MLRAIKVYFHKIYILRTEEKNQTITFKSSKNYYYYYWYYLFAERLFQFSIHSPTTKIYKITFYNDHCF